MGLSVTKAISSGMMVWKITVATVKYAVLPSVSREVLRAGPDVAALRAAVAGQIDAFAFLDR